MGRCIREVLPGIRCGFPVKSGGDRHAIGMCPSRGRHGDRGYSLYPRRKSSGAEQAILFNPRGQVVGGLKKKARGGKKG